MGFRELEFSLLILVFLINLASSYPIRKTLPSEFMQKSKIEDKRINGSKIEGGNHGVPHGGNSHGNGNGDSGSNHSPNTPGGAGVIPVYAGGAAAANNNRNRHIHHGAANCNLNRINFSTTLMITLVYLLILLFL